MRVETDGETVGVQTDPEDADLARAVADTAQSLVTLATAVSGDPPDDTDGECYQCGEAGDLRPFPAASEDGEPISIDVCASCQPDLVERQLAANADAEPVEDA